MLATTAAVARRAIAPARDRGIVVCHAISTARRGVRVRAATFRRTEFHSSPTAAASAGTGGGAGGRRRRGDDNGAELERCVALDSRRMSRASLFGLSAVPIAVAVDSALFSVFEAEIQSSILTETGSMIFAMHMGWSLSWFICIRTLHMGGDPLTGLAGRWGRMYQARLFGGPAAGSGAGAGAGDGRGGDDPPPSTTAAPASDRFIAPEEWYEARRLNLERVRDSYNAGLYGPVSLVFAVAPFVSFTDDFGTAEDYEYHFPSSVWSDEEGGPGAETTDVGDGMGSAMYQPSLLDSVLEGNPNIYDLGMLGLCAAGTFLAGRKAYRSWMAVQANPPTDLPLRVSLRAAAVAPEATTDAGTRAAAARR